MNVVLARDLAAGDYGIFALVFSGLLLLGMAHEAVFAEPLLVFNAKERREVIALRLGEAVALHVAVTGSLSLAAGVLAMLVAAFGQGSAAVVVAAAVVAPIVLLHWMLRRAAYLVDPTIGLRGSVVYLCSLLLAVTALHGADRLSLETSLGCLVAAGITSSLYLARALRISFSGVRPQAVRTLGRTYWGYGRWALAAAILRWLPGNSFYIVLPAWWGYAEGARYKTAMNLAMPALLGLSSMSLVLLPALARRKGSTHERQIMVRLLCGVVIVAGLTWVAIGTIGGPLMRMLYGAKYDPGAATVWLVGSLPLSTGLMAVLGANLRAAKRVRDVFAASAAAGATAVTVGFLLVWMLGTRGALMGLVLSNVIASTIMLLLSLSPRTARDRLPWTSAVAAVATES